MKLFDGLPLWGAIAILGVLIVIGIFLTDHYHSIWPLVAVVVVDVIVGGLFLREYSQRPLSERPVFVPGSMASLRPGATPAATAANPDFVDDDTEFDDPVIEADRIGSGQVVPAAPTEEGAPAAPARRTEPPSSP